MKLQEQMTGNVIFNGALFVYISPTFLWIWHVENMHFAYML